MSEFQINQVLSANGQLLAESEQFSYLLHENAEVAWFILVPHTEICELYQLDAEFQQQVYCQINLLSEFIQAHFSVHKMNVATIGNVVSQLHIHVIGRRRDDLYWPDVVWGRNYKKTRSSSQIELITRQFLAFAPGVCRPKKAVDKPIFDF